MRAIVFTAVDELCVREDLPAPQAEAGEVVVSLRAAALNHRDLWILRGQYAGLRWPIIPGSDGAGVVNALGEGVSPEWLGREVIINPAFGWGAGAAAAGPDFSILGLPRDGTFAEAVAVPVGQLAPKPDHLDLPHAAALPLAGLTAWRALMTRAQLRAGERVLVSGIGGGVALFALQFAKAAGAHVWVTSSDPEKLARAAELGASGGFLYTEPFPERARGSFDVIIDGAGGPGLDALIDAAAPGGRIVSYGATRGNVPELALRKVFWKQLSLLGTTMGSPADWAAMLDFVTRREIRPILGVTWPLRRAEEAFALMERGDHMGKLVLAI
ncbi:alcohol dehydrogenase [Cephaloticoccus primus]|uniref:Alcohol dehydrogenase n=1 Tax=Cephaloticoccus primus TaxID=1548207 RepID=A0A139STR6_9BACT|nr:zinc-binding dehydrogenase [Cephaloticoccus primus]KXU37872.1 alcohol dehydrogenase [Cephaloticoccus primus]